jgi:methanogen homocitrate synthase
MTLKIEHKEVPSTANVLTQPFQNKIDHPILLHDNTLREGEQPPGVVFKPDEKFQIAETLNEFGIPWISLGFPAVSEEERSAALRISKAGFKMKKTALARMVESDIKAVIDCGADVVSLFFGGSDTHFRYKYQCTEAEALKKIENGLALAAKQGARAWFTLEDGSRTPFPRLLKIFQVAADAGAEYVKLADTVGVLTPTSCFRIVSALKESLAKPIGVHFHNDLGLALANSLAALEAGAELVDLTINGVGERAGNTCLEEMAVMLKVKFGIDLGFNLEKISKLSELVHRFSGTQAPSHKPITGKWCFTHEAGIHVDGILADPETYQCYPPKIIGRVHEIVFGKHSGAQSVNYLARQAGMELSESARKEVLNKIKTNAESKRSILDENQVLQWIKEAQ